MNADDLCFTPATTLAELIAGKKLSPVEVTEAVIVRAERLQPVLNLFSHPTFDEARAAARAAEQQVMAGGMLGALHGVPITIKDNTNVRGMPTGNGSIAIAPPVAAADQAVSARVRAAGAIILGKTTLPEFAHKVLTDSLATGVTRNPWNLDHTPGGSSGGASAALAAGVAPLAIGTDGGGSIRCPSSCTSVVGIKATLGRVPQEPFPDAFGNFAFIGPMTRTVADARLLLGVLSGPEPADPWTLHVPPLEAALPPVKGLRIGWMAEFGRYPTHPDVLACTESAMGALAAAGAIVEPLSDPCFDDVFDTYIVIATAAHAARLGPIGDAAGERMTDSLRESIAIGRRWSSTDLLLAQDRRAALFRAVQKLFARFDLIATPTMTAPPAKLDAGGSVATAFYAQWAAPLYPFNLTGHPAASVPAGLTEDGLPVGLQLVGPWYGEQRIVAAAQALEDALGFPGWKPPRA